MPQLKPDEWPTDGEPTTTERQVPISDADAAAVAQFRSSAVRGRGRAPRRKKPDEAAQQDERKQEQRD